MSLTGHVRTMENLRKKKSHDVKKIKIIDCCLGKIPLGNIKIIEK